MKKTLFLLVYNNTFIIIKIYQGITTTIHDLLLIMIPSGSTTKQKTSSIVGVVVVAEKKEEKDTSLTGLTSTTCNSLIGPK